MIRFHRLAALGVTACIALSASPAAADTPPSGLDQLKARAHEKVQERQAHLDDLAARLAKAPADCGHNTTLATELAEEKAGLGALDATIQAETDRRKAAAEYRQIFTDYRVYWLETPKTREVLACDRVAKAAAALTKAHDRIQARVDEAKAAGKDVSTAQAALDDMAAKTAAGLEAAKAADASVIRLSPDKGDRAVLAANREALRKGRQQLRTALDDLKAARADGRKAVDALKSA